MAKKYSGGGGGGSSVTVSNEGNNRVITSDGSGGLVGESNVEFDGTTLTGRYRAAVAQSVAIANGTIQMSSDLTIADGGDLVISGNAGFFIAPRVKPVEHTSSASLVANTHAGYYNFIVGSGIVITLPDNQTGGTHFTIISADANGFTLRTGTGAGDGDSMNGSQSDLTVAGFSNGCFNWN